jgi:hypothetical protein
MTIPLKSLLTCLGILSTGLIMTASANVAPTRPVLVELFTSEGCSSCPPADALLGVLAKQPGVLALAWHVEYLDGLGWKDKFSIHDSMHRQYDYLNRLGRDTIYMPQVIVDGDSETIGSDEPAVKRLIRAASSRPVEGPSLTFDRGAGGSSAVNIGPGKGSGAVWLVAFDRTATSSIGRGENAGRTLTEYQVVRSATQIGTWHGQSLELNLPAKTAEGEVVFIQPEAPGPMLASLAVER